MWTEVSSHINAHIDEQRVKVVVEEQKKLLNEEWGENKLKVVPGKDVLVKVFTKFGVRYNEVKDGKCIAQEMQSEEVPEEIKDIIRKIKVLVEPETK